MNDILKLGASGGVSDECTLESWRLHESEVVMEAKASDDRKRRKGQSPQGDSLTTGLEGKLKREEVKEAGQGLH